MMESIESNPYAPPQSMSEASIAHRRAAMPARLTRLLVVQAAVIVCSLALEAYRHESIVGTGSIFALVGLLIAIAAYRERNSLAFVYGCSAVAFTALIVFLINFYGWLPAQGDRPITMLAFGYAAFALAINCRLFLSRTPRDGKGLLTGGVQGS